MRMLKELKQGENVWVKDAGKYGKIFRHIKEAPRRYEVKTNDGGLLVRNRKHLVAAG